MLWFTPSPSPLKMEIPGSIELPEETSSIGLGRQLEEACYFLSYNR